MNAAPQSAARPDLPSDEELVPRVLAGETALFEVLIRRNNARVYRALRGLSRDEHEIEDLMQQSYVQAFANLSQFSGAARFSTWLVRIALNEGLQRRRRGSTWAVIAEQGALSGGLTMAARPESDASPEVFSATREAIRLVEAVLDSMPEIYRLAFVLREVEGLSTAEAAGALGASEDTVKQRLSRAKQLLRDGLAARAGESLAELFPFHAVRCDRVTEAVMRAIG